MNTPNKITISRIVATVILLVVLITLDLIPNFVLGNIPNTSINPIYLGVAIFFIIASATDAIDGHLARSRNEVTDLGKFLDPVADKLLVNSMLIFLILPHYGANGLSNLYLWCVILMIVRDLIVDALRFIAAKKGMVLAANIFGKAKTVLQMVAIVVALLGGFPFSYFDASWIPELRISMILMYLATIASLLSGIIYVTKNFSVLKESAK